MTSTAMTHHLRQPATRAAGAISTAVIGTALVTLMGIAVMTSIRNDGATLQFDPTAAQRVHHVREYGAEAAHDPSGALQAHVLRERGAATAWTLFDHVARENDAD